MNAFRLPVAWQFLVEQPGAPLITANMKQYDALMKACLATGSLCIIDIHNYARWDGLIVGQGGPSDEQFASLWSQLATQYKSEPKVVMGIVNEPHTGTFKISGFSMIEADISLKSLTSQDGQKPVRRSLMRYERQVPPTTT